MLLMPLGAVWIPDVSSASWGSMAPDDMQLIMGVIPYRDYARGHSHPDDCLCKGKNIPRRLHQGSRPKAL